MHIGNPTPSSLPQQNERMWSVRGIWHEWCGAMQVAVILVPGGQAELLHTWRLFRRKELVVHCKHKGTAGFHCAGLET